MTQETKHDFIRSFNAIACEVNQNAIDKGWWEQDRNDGEMIALMHSELSEGLEHLRHDSQSDHIPFRGIEEELADCIIRIMDYGIARKLDIPRALLAKMEFNSKREHKHGGKKF